MQHIPGGAGQARTRLPSVPSEAPSPSYAHFSSLGHQMLVWVAPPLAGLTLDETYTMGPSALGKCNPGYHQMLQGDDRGRVWVPCLKGQETLVYHLFPQLCTDTHNTWRQPDHSYSTGITSGHLFAAPHRIENEPALWAP